MGNDSFSDLFQSMLGQIHYGTADIQSRSVKELKASAIP